MIACIMSSVNKTLFFSNVLDDTKIGSLYKIVLHFKLYYDCDCGRADESGVTDGKKNLTKILNNVEF